MFFITRRSAGCSDKDPQLLVWDYSATLPKITTDAAKLKIILRNLISNALKFTEKGEVRVTARHHPESNRVTISIKDTGIGIDKGQSGLIFHKFWQADAAKIKDHGGMGLGLYIVKEFCELLGGTVTVASELGQGAEFTVVLPASRFGDLATDASSLSRAQKLSSWQTTVLGSSRSKSRTRSFQ